jgi:hypothetical protein
MLDAHGIATGESDPRDGRSGTTSGMQGFRG